MEEVEELCRLLAAEPPPPVDLSACTHLHTAVLQVLLRRRPRYLAPPQQPFLRDFIWPLLSKNP